MSSGDPPPQARFVSSTKYRSRPGSTHKDVPVNPTCPTAFGDICVPHEEVGNIVSHPSARELPGTVLFVMKLATSSGENGAGPLSSRAARRRRRAKAPTAGAVPNNPA